MLLTSAVSMTPEQGYAFLVTFGAALTQWAAAVGWLFAGATGLMWLVMKLLNAVASD